MAYKEQMFPSFVCHDGPRSLPLCTSCAQTSGTQMLQEVSDALKGLIQESAAVHAWRLPSLSHWLGGPPAQTLDLPSQTLIG